MRLAELEQERNNCAMISPPAVTLASAVGLLLPYARRLNGCRSDAAQQNF